MTPDTFSHVDESGRLSMVDVSGKDPTRRTARATSRVVTGHEACDDEPGPDGLYAVQRARLTGIVAAKQTPHLIPLCHPIGIDDIQISIVPCPNGWEIEAAVTTVGRTGVEMEALTACTYSALSLLGAVRERDPGAFMTSLTVREKTGGRSDWTRPDVPTR
jgi:cyclic pyranopterin phosphate synthase